MKRRTRTPNVESTTARRASQRRKKQHDAPKDNLDPHDESGVLLGDEKAKSEVGSQYDDYVSGFISLPKVEVHAHLGGSARRSTVREFFQVRRGMSAQQAEQAANGVLIPRVAGSPVEPVGYNGFGVVSDAHKDEPELIDRIVRDYLTDCANDGICYVELRTGGSNLGRLRVVTEAMRRHTPPSLTAKLIVSIKRERPAQEALETVRNAVELMDQGVVGIDFCGTNTTHQFTSEFAEVVAEGKRHGLAFVPHFAEFEGEKDLEAVLNAEPARIGHCVFPDEASWKRIVNAGIPIEWCLISNINTLRRDKKIAYDPPTEVNVTGMYSESALEVHHPLAALPHPLIQRWAPPVDGRMQHPVVLCCDNVGLLECPLSEVYRYAAEALIAHDSSLHGRDFDLGDPATVKAVKSAAWRLARESVEYILGGDEVKADLRAKVDEHPWATNTEDK